MKNKFKANEYIEHLDPEFKTQIEAQIEEENINLENSNIIRKGLSIKTEEENTFISILSDSTIDRDNEVLISNGIDTKAFEKNPVILWSHKMGEPPVGSVIKFQKTPTELIVKVKMAETPFAKDLFTLIKGGHLKSMSIGFLPTEHLVKGTKEFDSFIKENREIYKNINKANVIFSKSILLEGSLVSIPANTNSEILSVSKDFSEETLEKLSFSNNMGIKLEKSNSEVIYKVIRKPIDEQELIEKFTREYLEILTGKI